MTSAAEGSSVHGPDEDPSVDPTVPLDSVANLRLLGEVQRRGLEAANQVIARLTERTNAAGPGAARSGGDDQMTAMADAFVESVSAAMATMTPMVDRIQPSTTVQSGEPDSPEVLRAQGAPGEQVDVQLWMHNYTDALAQGIEIHLSELVRARGDRLSPRCVTLRPDHPFDLSAASSRSVQLTVDLATDVPPGRYRGIVTASHLADLWMVLEVEVRGDHTDPAALGDLPEPIPSDPVP